MSGIDIVRNLWDLFDKRRFEDSRKLLKKDVTVKWVTTKEVFIGTDNFIAINTEYPGAWRTIPVKIENYSDDKVFSLTHVFMEDSEEEYYATSFFEFEDGLISSVEEYWSTVESPPEWRRKYVK